jgi:hypothetical protein
VQLIVRACMGPATHGVCACARQPRIGPSNQCKWAAAWYLGRGVITYVCCICGVEGIWSVPRQRHCKAAYIAGGGVQAEWHACATSHSHPSTAAALATHQGSCPSSAVGQQGRRFMWASPCGRGGGRGPLEGAGGHGLGGDRGGFCCLWSSLLTPSPPPLPSRQHCQRHIVTLYFWPPQVIPCDRRTCVLWCG